MTKRLPLMLAALALAGCVTTRAGSEPGRGWFVGRWCPDGSTAHATVFADDGSYSTVEDNGRWRLDGKRLQRQTAANVRYEERVERLGRNRMARNSWGGQRTVWRRCTVRP